jgi:hypothetical protein
MNEETIIISTLKAGCVLMAALLVLFFIGGCTTAQLQKASIIAVESIDVATVAVTDAYAVTQGLCEAGSIDAKTCAKIDKDYAYAQSAIKAASGIEDAAGSIATAKNSGDYQAAIAKVVAVTVEFIAIENAIKGGK